MVDAGEHVEEDGLDVEGEAAKEADMATELEKEDAEETG